MKFWGESEEIASREIIRLLALLVAPFQEPTTTSVAPISTESHLSNPDEKKQKTKSLLGL